MKYTIVICLLFAIVNSKRDFSNKLGLAKSLIGSTYVSKGIKNVCEEIETRDQCLAVENPLEKDQCCFTQMIFMEQVSLIKDEKYNEIKYYIPFNFNNSIINFSPKKEY